MKYFSIKRDNKYPCFCQACLVGKPLDDMSPDPRYCQSCYEFLLKEAELDKRYSRAAWKPIPTITPEAKIEAEKHWHWR